MNFLRDQSGSCIAIYGGIETPLISSERSSVPKINQNLAGLEQGWVRIFILGEISNITPSNQTIYPFIIYNAEKQINDQAMLSIHKYQNILNILPYHRLLLLLVSSLDRWPLLHRSQDPPEKQKFHLNITVGIFQFTYICN